MAASSRMREIVIVSDKVRNWRRAVYGGRQRTAPYEPNVAGHVNRRLLTPEPTASNLVCRVSERPRRPFRKHHRDWTRTSGRGAQPLIRLTPPPLFPTHRSFSCVRRVPG